MRIHLEGTLGIEQDVLLEMEIIYKSEIGIVTGVDQGIDRP